MCKAEVVFESESELGEGAVWDYRNKRLIWLDITGKKINFFYPESSMNQVLQMNLMPGTVVPTESGGLIGAFENGFSMVDETSGSLLPLADPEKNNPGTRFNDGKCDPSGRFWAGTMGRNGEEGRGSLYRLNKDFTAERMLSRIHISNGITWAPDSKHMYYTDTLSREVWCFDYHDSDGAITNRRTVVKVAGEDGYPDGITIDAEGYLWVAHWGGGRVVCYDPADGKKVHEIMLPVSLVTSCAFGGMSLDELYITTARLGLGRKELEAEPLSGSLFVCRPGVRGIKANYYAG